MKMTTRVAFDNMKYYKNRNILIGITIILTTMLLFIVPAVGRGILEIQFAVTGSIRHGMLFTGMWMRRRPVNWRCIMIYPSSASEATQAI